MQIRRRRHVRQRSEWRKVGEKKKGGIDGMKEAESATGSFSASYRWPPARAFRHWRIPGGGQAGREGAGREGGAERGGWGTLAVCCQRKSTRLKRYLSCWTLTFKLWYDTEFSSKSHCAVFLHFLLHAMNLVSEWESQLHTHTGVWFSQKKSKSSTSG